MGSDDIGWGLQTDGALTVTLLIRVVSVVAYGVGARRGCYV